MMQHCSSKVAQTLLVVFNAIFLFCGTAIVTLGFIDVEHERSVKQILDDVSGINAALVTTGAFVCLLSSMGCCDALTKSNCMIRTYLLAVVFVIILQVAVGSIVIYKGDDLKTFVRLKAKETLKQRRDNHIIAGAWDDIQTTFGCCGADLPSDYPPMHLP